MHNSLLNTPVESAYRLLLALHVWPMGEYSARWISALDFISEYGRLFEISDSNLHGDNGMKFTEYVVRIETVDSALRKMVLSGWASVSVSDTGYYYGITPDGCRLAQMLQTSYAKMYRQVADAAYKRYGQMTAQELDVMINQYSVQSASKENSYD